MRVPSNGNAAIAGRGADRLDQHAFSDAAADRAVVHVEGADGDRDRFSEQQLPDDKHYGGEGTNQQVLANKHTSKRKELAGNSSTDDNPSPKKKLNHSSSTCKGCGIEGHNQDACGKTKAAFYNSGPTDYDKSPAWADVLKEHPRIEEIIKKPRIPSGFHLKELSLLTGQTVSKRGK